LTRKSPVEKYLRSHAESELDERIELTRSYQHVACIPACDEAQTLSATLTALSQARSAHDALVIVVLNARQSASAEVHQANQECAEQLRSLADLDSGAMVEGQIQGMGLVLVDRYTKGRHLPEHQGVGLARKIAADLALAWIHDGSIRGPWIRSTDADVQVPMSYWQAPETDPQDRSAVIYPFVHRPEGDALQRQALAFYEGYLRYYVRGLSAAGSPYAFHTIGSLLCIEAVSYAKVRGFPKRQAGEDFYLLNKLAKVGRVETLSGEPVRLSGRTSDRVPFGTGLAVAQIREQLAQGRPYEVYNPLIFEALKQWLGALSIAADSGCSEAFSAALESISEPLGPVVRRAAAAAGALEPVHAALAAVKGEVLRKRIADGHDAFRTLKMVHALRDEGLGMRPALEALGESLNRSAD